MDFDEETAFFIGYDGHTHRRLPGTDKHMKLSRHGGVICQPFNQSHFPYTVIDRYFDQGFIFQKYSFERSFTSPAQWEEAIALLNEHSTCTRIKYNKHCNYYTVSYNVPILGYLHVRENAAEVIEKTWLCWRGRHIDPANIYLVRYHRGLAQGFDPICKIISTSEQGEKWGARETEHLSLLACGGYQTPYDAFTTLANGGTNKQTKKRTAGEKKRVSKGVCYELDLGKNAFIECLSFKGAYPIAVSFFPNKDDLIAQYYEDHGLELPAGELCPLLERGRQSKRPSKRCIKTIDPKYLAWTTLFSLQYRDIVTGTWRVYPQHLVGNGDVDSEHPVRVSLLARYLRLFPVQFHNRPGFRVQVYGHYADQKRAAEVEKRVLEGKEKRVYIEDKRVFGAKNKEGEEGGGVCYSLTLSTHSPLVRDGWQWGQRYWQYEK